MNFHFFIRKTAKGLPSSAGWGRNVSLEILAILYKNTATCSYIQWRYDQTHRTAAAGPRSDPAIDRAQRISAHAGGNFRGARLQLGELGRRAFASAGTKGRHRTGRRLLARYPVARC